LQLHDTTLLYAAHVFQDVARMSLDWKCTTADDENDFPNAIRMYIENNQALGHATEKLLVHEV